MFSWGNSIAAAPLRAERPPLQDISKAQNRRMIAARFDQQFTNSENAAQWGLADSLSVDASANYLVRRTLRMRCRYEYHNNPWMMGAANRLAKFVVGPNGPRLHVSIKTDVMEKANNEVTVSQLIEAKFAAWCKAVGLAEKLRNMRAARFYNGEGFNLLRTNPKVRHPVKLFPQEIESDQVQSPLFGTYPAQYPDQYFDGVVLDPWGNPETYHVLRQHPGAFGAFVIMGYEYDPWPARYVIHDYQRIRPGQQRGIPEAVPALDLFAELRRFRKAVTAAAETAADHAGVIETAAPADQTGPDAVTPDTGFGTAADYIQLKRRLFAVLPVGWKAGQMHAEQPTTTFDTFTLALLVEISQTLDMPLFILTGDARLANMSSAYVATQSFINSVNVDRAGYEVLLDKIFSEWLEEARLIPDYLPADLPDEIPHDWRWDRVSNHADPEKVANAARTRIASGVSCPSYECAMDGDEFEELATRAARDFGMTLEDYREALRQSIFTARGSIPPATLSPDERESAMPTKTP